MPKLLKEEERVAKRDKQDEKPRETTVEFLASLAGVLVTGLFIITFILGYFLYNTSLRDRNGALWSAGNGCEDMGLHATLANAFLHSQEHILHPTYPIFPNWPLGYPFLPDFSAATAMALGSPIGFGFFATAAFALGISRFSR